MFSTFFFFFYVCFATGIGCSWGWKGTIPFLEIFCLFLNLYVGWLFVSQIIQFQQYLPSNRLEICHFIFLLVKFSFVHVSKNSWTCIINVYFLKQSNCSIFRDKKSLMRRKQARKLVKSYMMSKAFEVQYANILVPYRIMFSE